jgi:hypothetical protein
VEHTRDPVFDIVAGYSLGALLLLSATRDPRNRPLVAIAPILSFDAENGRGGITPTTTRLAVQSRFEQSPLLALKLYLRLAGLSDLAAADLPYPESDLKWGLEALGKTHARADAIARAKLFVGTKDPLVAAAKIGHEAFGLTSLLDLNHDFRRLLPVVAALYPTTSE